jgi:hypothetical protein
MKRALGGELVERRLLLAAIAKKAVRRVFDDQKSIVFRELDNPPSLGCRARHARGVLEIRDRVQKLRHLPDERPFERLDVRTVRLDRDAGHLRAVAAQERNGAIVGGRLGENHVAGFQHVQAEKLDELKRPVAGQHAIDAHVLPVGQPFAERLEAERRSVLEHRRPLRAEDGARGLDHIVDRERLDGGDAASEVDGAYRLCRHTAERAKARRR